MRHLLITSMLALGVGCGAAMAQSAQTGGDSSCASGQTDCQKGGKAGEKVQGKAKMGEQAQGKAGAKVQEQAQGKAKVQTNEQAQGQAGANTDQNAQDNTQLKKKQQAQGKTKNGIEQNAQGSTKMQTNQQVQGQAGTSTDQNAQGNTQLKKKQQAQGKNGTSTGQNAQGNVDQNSRTASINNVTVEQKTQVTQIIHETNVEPVRDVNFEISVGIEVPRHRIHLHRLPSRIVKIIPAYEGYEYFVLADGRIVIVDPDTYEIVLILT